LARLILGVEVANLAPANAQSEASTRAEAVIRYLCSSSVRQEDVRTLYFAVYPEHPAAQAPAASGRGFRVEHLLEVRTRDVANVGGLTDAARASTVCSSKLMTRSRCEPRLGPPPFAMHVSVPSTLRARLA
jgi:uncharacterized protein YggE